MKSITSHPFFVVLLSLLLVATTAAKDPTKPGLMRQAIAHLEAAKNAKEPLVSLRSARRDVVKAKPNKGGERKDAINSIDQAIKAAQAGDEKVMVANISDAIYDLKQGINKAK